MSGIFVFDLGLDIGCRIGYLDVQGDGHGCGRIDDDLHGSAEAKCNRCWGGGIASLPLSLRNNGDAKAMREQR